MIQSLLAILHDTMILPTMYVFKVFAVLKVTALGSKLASPDASTKLHAHLRKLSSPKLKPSSHEPYIHPTRLSPQPFSDPPPHPLPPMLPWQPVRSHPPGSVVRGVKIVGFWVYGSWGVDFTFSVIGNLERFNKDICLLFFGNLSCHTRP